MGASEYLVVTEPGQVGTRFLDAVREDQYLHGVEYSGGIGMKAGYGFTSYGKAPRGWDAQRLISAVCNLTYGTHGVKLRAAARNDMKKLMDHIGPRATYELRQQYDDKWAPAIHFVVKDGKHAFFGMASS